MRPDKPELLAGPALRTIRDDGPTRRLCWFSTDADVVMHGGENLTHPSVDLAANVRSAGYGYTVGRTIFSAYVPTSLCRDTDFIVDVATQRHRAIRHDRPLYDPDGARIRA